MSLKFWHDGWFAVDFTVDELKTLRKKQSKEFRDQSFNGQLQIVTLDEYIRIARSAGRPVGIYPELKDPEWINSLDFVNTSSRRFEDIVLNILIRCLLRYLFLILDFIFIFIVKAIHTISSIPN